MENKVELVKFGAALVVGTGVHSILTNIVKETTPEGNSRLNKVFTWVGVIVLTGMIGEKACEYVDTKIDAVVDYINTTMVRVKEELK